VKKNQKSLYQALQDAFELSDSNEPGHLEQEHGHIEYPAYDVLSAEQFYSTVRAHWGVEKRLHWVLDVTMREDDKSERQSQTEAGYYERGGAGLNRECLKNVHALAPF